MTLTVREYYDLMLETIRGYAEEDHQMRIRIWQLADLMPAEKSYQIYAVRCGNGKYSDELPVCRANRTMLSVTSTGEVVPCMQMSGYYEGHGISLGNVMRDGLKKILQSGPYLDEVCKTTGELRTLNGKCGTCPWFRYCCGGCRALGLAMTDELNGSDMAKCIFFEEGYYRKTAEALSGWTNLEPVPELMGE